MDSEALSEGMIFISRDYKDVWTILSIDFDRKFFIFFDEGTIHILKTLRDNEMLVSFWVAKGMNRLL